MKEAPGIPEYATPAVVSLTKMGRGQGQAFLCRTGTSATGSCWSGVVPLEPCESGSAAGVQGCAGGNGGENG